MKKKTVPEFKKMKEAKEQVAFISAYDYLMASFAEEAGADMIMMGDSLGMVVLGYEGTNAVTLEDCLFCARAVRRGAPNTWIVGDMPFLTYEISGEEAVRNAGRYIKEAGVDCVKLEGGVRMQERIRSVVTAGIPVMGHIGLTPQSSGQIGGFKAQGRTAGSAELVIQDALAVQNAGAFSVLVEAVPPEVTKFLCELLNIPVYSIGAGPADGQMLICADVLGLFQAFKPKFVKKYADTGRIQTDAMRTFFSEVKSGEFPEDSHAYHITDSAEDFAKLFSKYR